MYHVCREGVGGVASALGRNKVILDHPALKELVDKLEGRIEEERLQKMI